MIRKYFPILTLLGIHLFLLVNLSFTAWPEMFSYPYLKNHGFLLYQDMIHPYPPVLTLSLSYVYAVFGYKLVVLQYVTWGLILSSAFLVWTLAKYVSKSNISALVAAGFYVFLQPFLDGNMMWFDIAIVFPILLGTLFFLRNSLLLSGIFFAFAGLTKQTAGLFFIAVLVWMIVRKTPIKSMQHFLIGPFLFGIPLFVRLWQENAILGFWRWVVWYPTTQWSTFPGYVQMDISGRDVSILLSLAGILLFALWQGRREIKRKEVSILFGCLLLSLVMVYPRFSFFHFQLALSFICVLAGIFFSAVRSPVRVGLITLFFLVMIPLLYSPAISASWNKPARFYGEADKELGDAISGLVQENDTVFFGGVPSQMYVLANRLPPKPWTDIYVWYLEIPGVQDEILAKWRKLPPNIVIWQNPDQGPWYKPGVYQPKEIVNFISQNYTKEQEVRPGMWVWRKN